MHDGTMGILFVLILSWLLVNNATGCVDDLYKKTKEARHGMDSVQASNARLMESAPKKRRLSGANKEEDVDCIFEDTPHTATRRNSSRSSSSTDSKDSQRYKTESNSGREVNCKKLKLFAPTEEDDVAVVSVDMPRSNSDRESNCSEGLKVESSSSPERSHKINTPQSRVQIIPEPPQRNSRTSQDFPAGPLELLRHQEIMMHHELLRYHNLMMQQELLRHQQIMRHYDLMRHQVQIIPEPPQRNSRTSQDSPADPLWQPQNITPEYVDCEDGQLLPLITLAWHNRKTVSMCIRRQRYGEQGMKLVCDKATALNKKHLATVNHLCGVQCPLPSVNSKLLRVVFAELKKDLQSMVFVGYDVARRAVTLKTNDEWSADYFKVDAFGDGLKEMILFAATRFKLHYNIVTDVHNDLQYGMQLRDATPNGSSGDHGGTTLMGTPVDSVVPNFSGYFVLYYVYSPSVAMQHCDRSLTICVADHGLARSVQLMALSVLIGTGAIRVEYGKSGVLWKRVQRSWNRLFKSCEMNGLAIAQEMKVKDIFRAVKKEVSKLSKLELGDLVERANCGNLWTFSRLKP